jgi:hypothetical protein
MAVRQVVGFIKGKSAIHLARVYGERKRNFVGQHFWARGYFVSTVGRGLGLDRPFAPNCFDQRRLRSGDNNIEAASRCGRGDAGA